MDIAILLQGLATVSWVAALAIIILAVIRTSRGRPIKAAGGMIIGIVIAAIVLTTVSAGLVFIKPEERGLVLSAIAPGGFRSEALPSGLHWIIPFAESVVRYSISRQTYTMSIAPLEGQIQGDDSVAARTSDGQEVLIDASVIYELDPEKVIQVHIAWQNRYANDLVRPISRGIIRDEAAQYGVEEIVTSRRVELIAGIKSRLDEVLQENGLRLVDFVLRNITFTPEYAASVEQKQIAEQLAQQAELTVEQRRQEALQAVEVAKGQADAAVTVAQGQAQARVIEAEAEAEALALIAEALRDNPDLLTYQYIAKLAPGIQVMLVPSNNPYILPLPALETNPYAE
ncbi:MAG TPA: prohibitin family protein [Anaerolineae bacterium]|nr:prohibitin family protein [Anaerolineae bacterium]